MTERAAPGWLRRAALGIGVAASLVAASPATLPAETGSPPGTPGRAASASGELRILDAFSLPTHGAPVGVVYLRIENRGAEGDRLVSVESSAARSAQLHESVREGDTVKMRRRAELEIPAGGSVALEPGGLHVMLMGLRERLRAGQTLDLVLGFARAGAVSVSVPVTAGDVSP